MKAVLSVALLTLLAANTYAAKVYQWKDASGNIVFSDQPPLGQKSETKDMKANVVQTSGGTFSTREAIRKSPVVLWVNNCGENCDSARSLLGKRGVPYGMRNPQASSADAEQLKKVAGELVVPVLQVGEKTLRGFQAQTWNDALDAAGYGKTGDPTITNPVTQIKAPEAPAANQPAAPTAANTGTAPAAKK